MALSLYGDTIKVSFIRWSRGKIFVITHAELRTVLGTRLQHSESLPPSGWDSRTFPGPTKELLMKLSVDSNVLHLAQI